MPPSVCLTPNCGWEEIYPVRVRCIKFFKSSPAIRLRENNIFAEGCSPIFGGVLIALRLLPDGRARAAAPFAAGHDPAQPWVQDRPIFLGLFLVPGPLPSASLAQGRRGVPAKGIRSLA